MKFVKEVNGKEVTIELHDKNTFNIPIRAGFKAVEETVDEEHTALVEKAKELGIKSAHMMKKETLIAKIAEIENKE